MKPKSSRFLKDSGDRRLVESAMPTDDGRDVQLTMKTTEIAEIRWGVGRCKVFVEVLPN